MSKRLEVRIITNSTMSGYKNGCLGGRQALRHFAFTINPHRPASPSAGSKLVQAVSKGESGDLN